jgi:hypothetical protein
MGQGRLTRLAAAAVFALALIGAAGCGDKEEPETVQRVTVPPVNEKKVKFSEIEHTEQAGKFTGEQKVVASDIDRIVQAINEDDAEFMCSQGYTKQDIEILNAQGKCAAAVESFLKIYAAYQLDIEEIKVKGDTAQVRTRVITAFKKEKDPMVRPIPMKFVKQDGQWRLVLNLERRLEEAPPTSEAGVIQDDPSTERDESTEPNPEPKE